MHKAPKTFNISESCIFIMESYALHLRFQSTTNKFAVSEGCHFWTNATDATLNCQSKSSFLSCRKSPFHQLQRPHGGLRAASMPNQMKHEPDSRPSELNICASSQTSFFSSSIMSLPLASAEFCVVFSC